MAASDRVAALRFPAEWAVIGGFAVNMRITHVHRLTNDLDTVSRDQASLVEILGGVRCLIAWPPPSFNPESPDRERPSTISSSILAV